MSAGLKKRVNGKFVEVGATSEVLFRGEWASDSVLDRLTFDTATLPDGVTSTLSGTSQILYNFEKPVESPFARSVFLRIDAANLVHQARLHLDLAPYENVSRVVYTAISSPRTNHAYGSNTVNRAQVNGVDAWAPKAPAFVWDDYSVPASDGDVVTIGADGAYPSGTSLFRTEMGLYVHKIDIYGRAEPYLSGQFVTHEGKMWKSEIDNNINTPGADGTWTETLTLPPSRGTTAERPDPVSAGSGYDYFDETLSRPIWSNGTAWVDAGGIAV